MRSAFGRSGVRAFGRSGLWAFGCLGVWGVQFVCKTHCVEVDISDISMAAQYRSASFDVSEKNPLFRNVSKLSKRQTHAYVGRHFPLAMMEKKPYNEPINTCN